MQQLTVEAANATLAWLKRRGEGDWPTGFDPVGEWSASVWVLNAMWEAEDVPGGLTHDDVRRIELAAGTAEPLVVGDVNLDERWPDSVVIGGGLGASYAPGAGWDRLRWSDLAQRLGVDPFAGNGFPGHQSFPYRSWPANIIPPSESSLDHDQFLRLLGHLEAQSRRGAETVCDCFYAPAATGNWDESLVLRCTMAELPALYDERNGSPTNIWPGDHAWFVYTDADLWGSRVSGTDDLITAIVGDDEIEAVVRP